MIHLYTDGGARGNPGPAGIGGVLLDNKKPIFEFSKYIGETTNNIAEYSALVEGLTKAESLNIKIIECFLDSELIVKQLNGEYKVKNAGLAPYFEKVKKLEKNFTQISFKHVKRESNKRADSLVNAALDNYAL